MKKMYNGLSEATCEVFGAAGMLTKTIYIFSEAGHAEGMKVRFKQEAGDEEMFTTSIAALKISDARKAYLTRKYITNR